ncbi:MAG: serine/threonine protein kinase, partial [Myxococcales bacterium]|nr:serine/threonine protein kinase [Myxococcales bacterium]
VYRARHEVVGRDVAIKFLSRDRAHDPTYKARFMREARAANRINHEHIIDITDYGETADGLVYLVMELLDGIPISELISGGPIDPPRALRLVAQVAGALGRGHELDVIHRDIKPENIFILRDRGGDFVKILDFGLAHVKGERRVTATGSILGTPEYMSPEQVRGAPLGPPTDIYSLGCLLFEMLTGQLPFRGTTTELIMKHMRAEPPVPSSLLASIGAEVDALVFEMLRKEPTERPTAFEIVERLRALDIVAEPAAPSEPPPRAPSEPPLLPGPGALAEVWRERVQLFEELIVRAHPEGDRPAWLVRAAARLTELAETMSQMRGQVDARATLAIRQEDATRAVRMRIGRAVDALAADEVRVRREMEALDQAMAGDRARLGRVRRLLRDVWSRLSHAMEGGPGEPEQMRALREAGDLAREWLEAHGEIERRSAELRTLEAAHDDLSFQIAQLKGRMGSLSAGSEVDLGELRRESVDLYSRVEELNDEITRAAEPVVRHLMSFPDLRDAVRSVRSGAAALG